MTLSVVPRLEADLGEGMFFFELKLDTLLTKFGRPAVQYLLAQKVKIPLNQQKPTLVDSISSRVWCDAD